jgi:uncharacterized membrane protein YdbT with pleckstrin-like domain
MKLQEGEILIHELRPEPIVLRILLFTKCLPAAFVGAFLCFWCFGFFGGMFSTHHPAEGGGPFAAGWITALVAAPVILVLALVYCDSLRKTYLYYVTNQRCVFHGGILRKSVRSIPYHKITDVEMSQNILEQFLGISSLKIFTPGPSSAEGQGAQILFVGLKDNQTPAATINEILRQFKATAE